MSTSKEKTIILIFLMIVILLFAIGTTPLILGPFGVFAGFTSIWKNLNFNHIFLGPGPFLRHSILGGFSLFFLILWILVIVWVYRDAEKKGMNGILWALLVFIGNLIGLIIYLIVRSNNTTVLPPSKNLITCPQCHQEVNSEFTFCPHCGNRLTAVCPKCGRHVEESWKACPYCGHQLKSE